MEGPITRDYLQSLYKDRLKREIDDVIKPIVDDVTSNILSLAPTGVTKYEIGGSFLVKQARKFADTTPEEFLECVKKAILEKFPDIDVGINNETCCITINWS